MKRALFDMDGVLAAFDQDYERLTGATWEHRATLTKLQKWGMLDQHPFFFRDLPWMHGARAMFEFVQYAEPMTGYVPGIMSAASWHVPASKGQKYEWLDREISNGLDPVNVHIVDQREDKAAFALPGEMLVDDHILNVADWNAAGGIGILYKDSVQAIDDLQKHLKTPERYYMTARLFASQNLNAADKLVQYVSV